MPKDIQFIEQPPASDPDPSSNKIIINEREDFIAAMDKQGALTTGESPRATVLIYSAAIENALTDALRTFMVPSNQKNDSVLTQTAATFETRIDLAYRLGMISHGFWRELHIIRDLRDDAVERIDHFSFDHHAVQASLASLIRNIGKQAFASVPFGRMDAAARYSYIARLFLVTLQDMKFHNRRLPEAKRERFYVEI